MLSKTFECKNTCEQLDHNYKKGNFPQKKMLENIPLVDSGCWDYEFFFTYKNTCKYA